MLKVITVIGAFLLIAFLIDVFDGYFSKQKNGKLFLLETLKRFPGSCPICSYHRYGILNGHVKAGDEVPEHRCPEEERK